MSCTHDCGCTQTVKDARTDDWGQIAPESARPATLTPEQPVKAPVEGEDSQRPSGPVLPRRIKPEDVRVGMVVERRKGEAAHRDRVQQIDGDLIVGTDGAWLWVPANADGGWSLWLIEDAPAPVDPDAAVIEVMARVTHDQNCCKEWDDHGNGVREVWREAARDALDTLWEEGYRIEANTMSQDAPAPVDPDAAAIEVMARAAHELNCAQGWYDWDEHGESAREMWRKDARAVLAALRETHDVTARAEQ